MKKMFNNRVVIIGGDNYNTLAAIRCFGRCKADFEVLIYSTTTDERDIKVSKSKYVHGNLHVIEPDEKVIYEWLLDNELTNKQFVFPCSDYSMYVLDKYYSSLNDKYFIPGFRNNPGKIVELMSKYKQYEFALSRGIPTARSWIIDPSNPNCPVEIPFPCIVKPYNSIYGTKEDIRICDTKNKLYSTIDELVLKNKKTVIVQEYIDKDYEYCAFGYLSENESYSAFGIIKKIRESIPGGGGSVTYGEFIEGTPVNALNASILKILSEFGYRGQFDIEYFSVGQRVILNEINFRQSGNACALINNDIFAPYIWCLDELNLPLNGMKVKIKCGSMYIDEIHDYVKAKVNGIKISTYIHDLLTADAYSFFSKFDIPGTLAFYLPLIRNRKKRG